jgi:hypothetical protein
MAIHRPPESLENSGLFDVGPVEQAEGTPNVEPYPQLFGPDSVEAGWSDSVQTIANVLGGTEPAAPNCNSMVEPGAIVGADVLLLEGLPACTDQFWVFAAAQQSVDFDLTVEDTVTGHFATFINPMGEIRPAIADTIDPAALAPLFDGRGGTPDSTIFPCGFGHVALTLCTADHPSMDSGALVSDGVATGGPLPTAWDGTPRSYAVEFDSAAATALLDEAGWSLESSGDDRVRALIRDDSITFVFPQDAVDPLDEAFEDLFYALTSTIDGHITEQPHVPVVGLITSPPSLEVIEPEETAVEEEPPPPPQLIETLDEFYSQLSASIAAGDVGFAFDRLAPAVLEAYPTECPAALESFADPGLLIVPTSEGDAEPWTWELADGRTFDIPSARPVTVVLTGRGQPGTESEAHLEVINEQYHWFTFCE